MIVSYVTLIVALGFPPRLLYLFLGQLGNVVLNIVTKHLVKLPRPEGKPHLVHFGKYGMPSNHSQFMFFLATFAALASFSGSEPIVAYQKAIAGFIGMLACLVSYSRVYLEYHSADQVVVGCLVGGFAGALWFFIGQIILRKMRKNKAN